MGAKGNITPSPKREMTKNMKLLHLFYKLWRIKKDWLLWKDLDRKYSEELHKIGLSPKCGDVKDVTLRTDVTGLHHKKFLRRKPVYNPGTNKYIYSISKAGMKVLKYYGLATQEDLDRYDWENR